MKYWAGWIIRHFGDAVCWRSKKSFGSSVSCITFALPLGGNAQVAKLVDALSSGGSVRKDVLVRIQSWAQEVPVSFEAGTFFSGIVLYFRTQYEIQTGIISTQ